MASTGEFGRPLSRTSLASHLPTADLSVPMRRQEWAIRGAGRRDSLEMRYTLMLGLSY